MVHFTVIAQEPCFSLWCCSSVQPHPSSGTLIPTPEGTHPFDLQHGLFRPQVGTVSSYHLKQPPQDYECGLLDLRPLYPLVSLLETGIKGTNLTGQGLKEGVGYKTQPPVRAHLTSLSELGQCIVLGVLPCRKTHDPGS